MQWTYAMKGSHPEYRIPKPGGGRLDNKITKDVELKLMHRSPTGTKKNFVKDNIKKQKATDKKASETKGKGDFTSSKYSKP